MELLVFILASAMVLVGAIGVITRSHPVHAALSLILTLFGVAVHFVAMEAHFLAAVQVIVYAGAIVVLFLFVIMLLGVDRATALKRDPILGQRPLAVLTGAGLLGLGLTALLAGASRVTGERSSLAPLDPDVPDVDRLGRVLFTDYVFAFEITAVLLTIAVVGAAVLSRRAKKPIDLDEFPEGTAAEELERVRASQDVEQEAAPAAGGSGDGEDAR